MKALTRKLVRDVVRMRGQMISIALVVAAGVMSAITMLSTYRSLESSRDRYYRDYRMADVFASLNRSPQWVGDRIARIPGVSAVHTRVVLSVTLSVPGLERPATGHIVSIPEQRTPILSDLHLRAGRWVEPGRDDEVLVSERFAEVNGLRLGDTMTAVLNGRSRTLHVVGTALSPEFVYEVEPAGGFLTDERLFGVMWMGRNALAAAADMTGAFNQVVVRLAPGASEAAVIDRMDTLLRPWGGLGAFGREDQLSNRLVNDELAGIRVTATFVPIVFLGIAAFLLHIVMARLIATEREHIAMLKAFGYRDSEVARHYLGLAFAAIGIGAMIGLIAGIRLGSSYTNLYSQYFRFPELRYQVGWDVAAGAILISAAAALAGAASTLRQVARLQPAQGMRADAPAMFRPLLMERLGLHRWLSPAQRMVLRNVERRPVRALLSAFGVSAGLAVLVVGFIMLDSMTAMMRLQFSVVQREDVAVTFTDARDISAARELARVPGVIAAEPLRMVPVRLAHAHRSRRLALTGLDPAGTLRVMADADGNAHALPHDGIVLTARLARSLGVQRGDTLHAELLDRAGERRTLVVAATMDEAIGINAYLALDALNRLMREGPQASGVNLSLQRGQETAVLRELREFPAIASTTSKNAMVRSFEDQISESFAVATSIMVTLASILSMGVIYNGARIALSERSRELASLRVLGFSRNEVAAMLLGEQAVITATGIPLGLAFGVGLAAIVLAAYDTELYRLSLHVLPSTLIWTSLTIIAVAALAGLLVRRRLDRADLISVLKTRE